MTALRSSALRPLLSDLDFSFKTDGKAALSWSMNCESTINSSIKDFLDSNPDAKRTVRAIFLQMDAASLLLKYLYAIQRKATVRKSEIYDDFFEAPFVRAYLDRHGLEQPTEEVRKRRVPFLLNILDALGIISQSASEITVLSFIPAKEVLRFSAKEHDDVVNERVEKLKQFKQDGLVNFETDEVSILKETYGANFLTQNYYLQIGEI